MVKIRAEIVTLCNRVRQEKAKRFIFKKLIEFYYLM